LSDFLDGGKYLARDIDELHPDFMRQGSPKYGQPYFLKTRELGLNNRFGCLFLGLFNKAWDV